MMRGSVLIATGAIALMLPAAAATAQQARNTPSQIICAMTDTCGTTPPGADRQIEVGGEKAFSLAKPAGGRSTSLPNATPAPRASQAVPPRRMASAPRRAARPGAGRLDMLVTFKLGSAEMTPQAKAEAQAFAKAMGAPQLAAMHFAIEGHTDAIGNRDYNNDLSQRRAQAVVDYLVSLGADPQRLQAKGYGFDKPKPGLTPKAPGNRRVEFVRQA